MLNLRRSVFSLYKIFKVENSKELKFQFSFDIKRNLLTSNTYSCKSRDEKYEKAKTRSYESRIFQTRNTEYDEMIQFVEDRHDNKKELRTLEDLTIDELEEIYDYNNFSWTEKNLDDEIEIKYPVPLTS